MSFLFPKAPQAPQPAPVPVSPAAPDNSESERVRQAAADKAATETANSGRRSTIVAGMKIAEEEQGQRGLLASKRRQAARDLGG